MRPRHFFAAPVSAIAMSLFVLLVGNTSVAAPPRSTSEDHDRFAPDDRKRLSSTELDSALKEDDETERAERAGEKTSEREPTSGVTRRARGWDFRFEAPGRSAGTSRGAAPARSEAASVEEGSERATAARSSRSPRTADTPYQLTLRRDFIEKYKNRVTLTTALRVVEAGPVHKATDDGDEHVAALADEVNLPMVAEVMNAKDESEAVGAMQDAASSGDVIQVYGSWRIWCEHPPQDKSPQIQDDPIPAYTGTNPDHMFEIHPVTKMATARGAVDLLQTLRPISGYAPKDADKAFAVYESLPCRLELDASAQTVSIFSKKVGYNYVEFIMEAEDERPFLTIDGRIVRSSVLNLNGELIHKDRRMVFVKDTPPEVAARKLNKGDRLHVLGIPRVDLAVVSYRIRNSAAKPEMLTWNLPYELIVVGVYSD